MLLVPPNLTAPMHLIWGNLENCSEIPASVIGGDLPCAGNFSLVLVQLINDYWPTLSQKWQPVKDAPDHP